jgi:hypothetical protein
MKSALKGLSTLALPPDVQSMREFYQKFAEPRYIEGYMQKGCAYNRQNLRWWIEQFVEEAIDGLFYAWQSLERLRPSGREFVYIAGPYTAEHIRDQERNIKKAEQAMIAIIKRGHIPFCPHTMSAWLDKSNPEIDKEVWLQIDLAWLELCSVAYFIEGWWQSSGAQQEYKRAQELNLKIIFSERELPEIPW